jgi:UDP-N-acetylglucosamine--N-acetylmuramyl-(pentapeptide) pyrophosphoryl-undecaprenol N-acetylglucosamine transferase
LAPIVLDDDDRALWVTFDTEQSRSLLEQQEHLFVPYVGPRDVRHWLQVLVRAPKIVREHKIERVVSTGAGVALAFFLAARLRRIRCEYIESAARVRGPSLTGRLAAMMPGVVVSTQYNSWASGKWQQRASVFDLFSPAPVRKVTPVKRVFVTLGTIKGYEFHSLADRIRQIVPSDVEIRIQSGATGIPEADGVRKFISLPEFDEEVAAADVVVSHAGIGSALRILETGKSPLLVPRRASRHEHVDDHQVQIADELSSRGLVVAREVHDLSWEDLKHSAAMQVTDVSQSSQDRVIDLRSPYPAETDVPANALIGSL